jgi:hypothetical protein
MIIITSSTSITPSLAPRDRKRSLDKASADKAGTNSDSSESDGDDWNELNGDSDSSTGEAPTITMQEQSDEEPEPVNDSFVLDIRRPDRDAEPALPRTSILYCRAQIEFWP